MRAKNIEILEMCRHLGDKTQLKRLTHDKEGRKYKYDGDELYNMFHLNSEVWKVADRYNETIQSLRDQYGIDAFTQEIEGKNAERERLTKLKAERDEQKNSLLAEAQKLIDEKKANTPEGTDFVEPRKARTLRKQAEDVAEVEIPDKDLRTLDDHPSITTFRKEVDKVLNRKVTLDCDRVWVTEDLFARAADAQDDWIKFPWFFYLTKKADLAKAKEEADRG
tara:strand:- start:5592 stop:6257 length:666 start_codon:yes stop_codon:yes gene_type:complete